MQATIPGLIAFLLEREKRKQQTLPQVPPMYFPQSQGRGTLEMPEFNVAPGVTSYAPTGPQRPETFWGRFLNSYQTNPNLPLFWRLMRSGG